MAKRKKSNYSIGRGKPPCDTQFKAGVSGNPKGRPKGSKKLASILQKELTNLIDVTEEGVRKKITKEQAMIKQLVNKAASGDARLMSLLLKELAADESHAVSEDVSDIFSSGPDDLVMENIVKRIRQMDSASSATDSPPPENPIDSESNS